MSWNPQTHEDYDALRGYAVYAADNARLGRIMHVFHPQADMPQARGGHYFLIEPDEDNDRFNAEVYVQELSIREIIPDQDAVILEVPADELIRDQQQHRPSDFGRFNRT
jgi:hypothetical protein